MGSGPKPPSAFTSTSPIASTGVIHCPDAGVARAGMTSADLVGQSGELRISGENVLLVTTAGDTIATLDPPARLRDCIAAGYRYIGKLEINGDGTVVRFRQR